MYKYGVYILSALLCYCTTYAANIVTQSGNVVTTSADMSILNDNDISKISIIYCDDDVINNIPTNKKFFFHTNVIARPGERKKICVLFVNRWDKETSIDISFVEWIKEKVGEVISCSWNQSKNIFENLFDLRKEDKKLTLPPNSQNLKIFTLDIPKNSTWNMYGCITYMGASPVVVANGEMFGIKIRKAGPMAIKIVWPVYYFWWRDNIKDFFSLAKSTILKGIIAIFSLRLILIIAKKEKNNKKINP